MVRPTTAVTTRGSSRPANASTRGSDDAGARVVERRDQLVEEAVRIQATDRDDRSPTALCMWIIEERRYECRICASPTLSETDERDLVGIQPLPVVRRGVHAVPLRSLLRGDPHRSTVVEEHRDGDRLSVGSDPNELPRCFCGEDCEPGREQSIELFGVVRARAGEHRAADDQSGERVVLSQRRFEGQVSGAACDQKPRRGVAYPLISIAQRRDELTIREPGDDVLSDLWQHTGRACSFSRQSVDERESAQDLGLGDGSIESRRSPAAHVRTSGNPIRRSDEEKSERVARLRHPQLPDRCFPYIPVDVHREERGREGLVS